MVRTTSRQKPIDRQPQHKARQVGVCRSQLGTQAGLLQIAQRPNQEGDKQMWIEEAAQLAFGEAA